MQLDHCFHVTWLTHFVISKLFHSISNTQWHQIAVSYCIWLIGNMTPWWVTATIAHFQSWKRPTGDLTRCKSQNLLVIFGPYCSITSQYLLSYAAKMSPPGTWFIVARPLHCWLQSPVHGFKSLGLKAMLIYWGHSLSVWTKLQHSSSTFGLVMVKTWPPVFITLPMGSVIVSSVTCKCIW